MFSARDYSIRRCAVLCACLALIASVGCEVQMPPAGGDGDGTSDFANTTDKTNAGASFLGSASCRECHEQISDWQNVHGHAHKLTRVQGAPPEYPAEGTRAGVPNPPEGFEWSDIAYVIGGYTKKGRFIDNDGFTLTTGVEGVDTQWNLDFPANGTEPGFVAYDSSRETPKPYNYSCFVCHTTGPLPQDEDFPEFQENRPGFAGTWEETGVQCESCHGPGGNHFATVDAEVVIDRAGIFVDADGAKSCNECHNRPFNSATGEIQASGGYIKHHEQWPELQASGGHASLTCITCHNPHRSVIYDRENAIRMSCTDCHPDASMAGHSGLVFERNDGYTEQLTCESCHMPFATRSAAAAAEELVAPAGRIGDTRTHIFRISTEPIDYNDFFSDDGSSVRLDGQGRAAVTVDFVCLRCHNEAGAFELGEDAAEQIERAAEIAIRMHELPE